MPPLAFVVVPAAGPDVVVELPLPATVVTGVAVPELTPTTGVEFMASSEDELSEEGL